MRGAISDRLLPALRGCKCLLLATDGELTRLPFEALPIGSGGRLMDEYHISYLSTGRDIRRFEFIANRVPGESLAIADPDFDFGTELSAEAA